MQLMSGGNCNSQASVLSPVEEVHISSEELLKVKDIVVGSPVERLFMISGQRRGKVADVFALHHIRSGIRSTPNSVQAVDTVAANAELRRLRAGRTDFHIGSSHSHRPPHKGKDGLPGPSSQDLVNIRKHAAEESGQVHFLFRDRGDGVMGFRALNAAGERIPVVVHDMQTGEERIDAPNSPDWRLEDNGSFTDPETPLHTAA